MIYFILITVSWALGVLTPAFIKMWKKERNNNPLIISKILNKSIIIKQRIPVLH